MNNISWDQLFISMCYLMSLKSPDPNTKVGSVITTIDNEVISLGYNGWPRGIDIPEGDVRLQRPAKYIWVCHAEENSILNAGRLGVQLKGCKLYVPWLPCTECAKAIIQSGIVKVIVHKEGQEAYEEANNKKHNWQEQHAITIQMFEEANIELEWWSGSMLNIEAIFNGKHITI